MFKLSVSVVLVFWFSTAIVSAQDVLTGTWVGIDGKELQFTHLGDEVMGIDRQSGREVLRASVNGRMLEGGILGEMPDGRIRETCPNWITAWQRAEWRLSEDGNSLVGSYYPIRIEQVRILRNCTPIELSSEPSMYTRTSDECEFVPVEQVAVVESDESLDAGVPMMSDGRPMEAISRSSLPGGVASPNEDVSLLGPTAYDFPAPNTDDLNAMQLARREAELAFDSIERARFLNEYENAQGRVFVENPALVGEDMQREKEIACNTEMNQWETTREIVIPFNSLAAREFEIAYHERRREHLLSMERIASEHLFGIFFELVTIGDGLLVRGISHRATVRPRAIFRSVGADVTRTPYRDQILRFLQEEVDFDIEVEEVFFFGTTFEQAAVFRPAAGRRLFTAADAATASVFAARRLTHVQGEKGIVAIILPRDIVARLRSGVRPCLTRGPIGGMHGRHEHVFSPSAIEEVTKFGEFVPLPAHLIP